MKTWLHNHRLRRHRSEAQLASIQRHPSEEMEIDASHQVISKLPGQTEAAAKLAASKTSSRMSIERYLSAPLEDEPASVPAITAALKNQSSQNPEQRVQANTHRGHSRESSYDANSDGRRTFYTSGSAPESSGTSYSVASKTHRRQRSKNPRNLPELPRLITSGLDNPNDKSPERPTTSGTIDLDRTWAERIEMLMPGYERDTSTNYRVKAEIEIARIQEKARQLEDRLNKYKAEIERNEPPASRVTDEMAYAQMAARPKLAWILGGDLSDARSIERPKSSGSMLVGSSDIHERPGSNSTLVEDQPNRIPRRTRSNSALDENPRHSHATQRSGSLISRKPSKRPRFYCTFCQKRFHSRLEWMRHEQAIHMPEELWVCCPRTGEFPARCPFCAKMHPSPSHLADHAYLSCQAKPISERTFSKKDHFLQHIASVHKVSPSQKPARLTELLDLWRHPLPLKTGHQALHCGFCGQIFETYEERTQHVGKHFVEDGLDMMAWWDGRLNHDTTPDIPLPRQTQNPDLPHKCIHCTRTFPNLPTAQSQHPICTSYSCAFLPGLPYTIYPSYTFSPSHSPSYTQSPSSSHAHAHTPSPSHLSARCCYCNTTLTHGARKVQAPFLKAHVRNHNFRACSQRLYFSGQRFRQHLVDGHGVVGEASLWAGWTLLMGASRRDRVSVFAAANTDTDKSTSVSAVRGLRRAYTDPETTTHNEDVQQKMNFMDLSSTPTTRSILPKRRLRRKSSAQTVSAREVRDSTHIFTRAATFDAAQRTTSPTPKNNSTHHRPGFPISSPPTSVTCPTFYRRRVDASTRNRLYVRDAEVPLSKNAARLFRRVEGSVFGGLVLGSALVGGVPVRMAGAVDVYGLH